jgi:hypothetical protein
VHSMHHQCSSNRFNQQPTPRNAPQSALATPGWVPAATPQLPSAWLFSEHLAGCGRQAGRRASQALLNRVLPTVTIPCNAALRFAALPSKTLPIHCCLLPGVVASQPDATHPSLLPPQPHLESGSIL